MGHLSETPTDEITTRSDFRSRNRQLAATMSKERRTYLPRIVGDKVMMPADLKRLHKTCSMLNTSALSLTRCARWSPGAELRLANGVMLIGKFDGEFASHSST